MLIQISQKIRPFNLMQEKDKILWKQAKGAHIE